MSIFSGKCDLYDSAVMIGEYDIDKIRLYITKNDRSYPIKLNEPRDLIPYYPFVPYISTYHDGIYTAYLSDSWIDYEEADVLTWQLKEIIRDYKRCKRKKIPFDTSNLNEWYDRRIIERVQQDGEKATIKGLHRSLANHWRKTLAEEMERNGYTDAEIINFVYPDAKYCQFDWHKDEY